MHFILKLQKSLYPAFKLYKINNEIHQLVSHDAETD